MDQPGCPKRPLPFVVPVNRRRKQPNMTTTKIASPRIASRAEWLEQRKALLAEQKEFTRLGDRLELQPSRVRHIHNDSFPRHAKYLYIARKRCDKDTRIFHSNTGSY